MKVVQINSVCKKGSTGKIAYDLSRTMTEEGIENYIFYGYGGCDYELAIPIGGMLNLRIHQIGARSCGQQGIFSSLATKKMIKKLKEIQPDVIHLHNIHGFYLNIPLLMKYIKEQKVKLVWTLHDCWTMTGNCSYFQISGCKQWREGCDKCPKDGQKGIPTKLLWDRSRKNYSEKKYWFTGMGQQTALVTPSRWLANIVKESFMKGYTTKVIHNGIDLDIFCPRTSDFRKRHHLETKYILLGVAAGMSLEKGLQTFLSLSDMIAEDMQIVLVGCSDMLVKTLKEKNNILALPATNNQKELAELYSMADAFVNPTLEDNFPTTNLEALGCGTPVVTYSGTGGSSEAIDEKVGFVVEKENVYALYQAINMIKKNGKETYEKECRNRALERFDRKKIFKEYIALYEEVLQKNEESHVSI